MEQEKTPFKATVLMFIGGILILLNAVLFASGGGPIIWSSGAIQPENLTGKNQPIWWRLSFGYGGWTAFATLTTVLVAAVLIIFSAMALLMKPRLSKIFGILVTVCSIISVVSGGGFIIGVILAFGGALIAMEFPKKAEETFFGRMCRAARFDSSFYKTAANDSTMSKQAVLALMFVNLLSGIGIGLYAYNSSLAINTKAKLLESILLFGETRLNLAIAIPPLAFMGIAVVKWIILTAIVYVVAMFAGAKPEGEKIARIVAFAYVPIALQFFIPFVFTSSAYLNMWPSIVFIATNIWMGIVLIAGLKETLEIGFFKTLGIVGSAGSAYYLINYFMFIKEGTAIHISQTINLLIYPEEFMLVGVFVVIAISVLAGAFTKR
jgi:hypothetical protein